MVERQLRRRGHLATSASSRRWRRSRGSASCPRSQRRRAYADGALPIGSGQTISQPWIVAAIAQALALDGDERVLDVGSGSGYSTAVLARLAPEVIEVERVEGLARAIARAPRRAGRTTSRSSSPTAAGASADRAPFEAIAVHATAPRPPRELLDQLTPGGRLVVPVAEPGVDMLTVFTREELDLDAGTASRAGDLGPTRFVPLIGHAAFARSAEEG